MLVTLLPIMALGGVGDVRQILIQLGVSVSLVLLTYPKFRVQITAKLANARTPATDSTRSWGSLVLGDQKRIVQSAVAHGCRR